MLRVTSSNNVGHVFLLRFRLKGDYLSQLTNLLAAVATILILLHILLFIILIPGGPAHHTG